jgi:hypothetical protein
MLLRSRLIGFSPTRGGTCRLFYFCVSPHGPFLVFFNPHFVLACRAKKPSVAWYDWLAAFCAGSFIHLVPPV